MIGKAVGEAESATRRAKWGLIGILALITLLRFWVSNRQGLWYWPTAWLDDRLLFNYADFHNHFLNPSVQSLSKTIAYSALIALTSATGIPFQMLLTGIWVIVALLMVQLFSFVTTNRAWLAFTYLFVLFTPTAFDEVLGTRLYRNQVFAPFIYLTFVLMLLLICYTIRSVSVGSTPTGVTVLIALGVVFTFTYYLNESGTWLLPCLVLTLLVCAAIRFLRWWKWRITADSGGIGDQLSNTVPGVQKFSRIRNSLQLLIPLAIFIVGTLGYQAINHHFFGVWQIETRQSGELGQFVHSVYRIRSDNRTPIIWAPADAIDAAFAASPTLSQYPQLRAAIGQPRGDFLTWYLRDALEATGMWTNEADMQALFRQANSEISAAFASGALVRDPRFQIVSSAGGRSGREITRLFPVVARTYWGFLRSGNLTPGGRPSMAGVHELDWLVQASYLTNFPLQAIGQLDPLTAADPLVQNAYDQGNAAARVIFSIYHILNPIMALTAIAGLGITAVQALRRRLKNGYLLAFLLATISLLGISAIYTLGISWFAEFIWWDNPASQLEQMLFYAVGLAPFLSIMLLFGTYLLFHWLLHTRQSRQRAVEVWWPTTDNPTSPTPMVVDLEVAETSAPRVLE